MRWVVTTVVLIWGATLLCGDKLPPGVHTQKTPRGVPFVVHIPRKASGMIFLLHGAGFRDINDAGNVWRGWAQDWTKKGFIVVIPFASGGAWSDAELSELGRLATELAATYNVPRRMGAAVGHSSGAEAAFKLVTANPSLISAAVSLGGRPKPNAQFFKEKNLAGYFFHFKNDPIVPVSAARSAYNSLKALSAETQLKEVDGNSHAIEFYLLQSKQTVEAWLIRWFKTKARVLGKVGQDDSLNWQEFSDNLFQNPALKLVLIYSYDSKKDKKSKICQWLEWDIFPNKKFQEAAQNIPCYKWDRANADKELLKKFSKFKRTGLYLVDVEKQKPVKTYKSPRSAQKIVKEITKLKEKYEKQKK